MTEKNFIGWDVGGAHLKVASVNEMGNVNFVKQYASPLWQGIECLEELFPVTINDLPKSDYHHALTITAELADVFENREQGVELLLNVFEKTLGNNISLYSYIDGLLTIDMARNQSSTIASANWHVSSRYAASLVGTGVFIDIGSTTTDIIPFQNGELINQGFDDQTRLRFDELIYMGVIRTPLMALCNKVPFKGEWQNVAAENFATTADVYRILSYLNEQDDLMHTADGKAKNNQASLQRLARMVGTDNIDNLDSTHLYKLAEYYKETQCQLISHALLKVLSGISDENIKLVVAGAGQFLAKVIADRLGLTCIEFSRLCSSDIEYTHSCDVCAPAVAIAQLNRQLTLR